MKGKSEWNGNSDLYNNTFSERNINIKRNNKINSKVIVIEIIILMLLTIVIAIAIAIVISITIMLVLSIAWEIVLAI